MPKRLPIVAVLLVVAFCGGKAGPPTETDVPLLQPIPAQGTPTTLDVANWNLEWFGATAYGPTNEALQLRHVQSVMTGLAADVWGLEEVVDAAQFRQLVSGLPGFAGLLADDPAVRQGSAYYAGGELKVALVWRTDEVRVDSARVILAGHEADFEGRPPVEFHLRVTLNGATESLVLIVMHAKAGSQLASWRQRDAAGQALKAYLDATSAARKVLVVGDFNDLAVGSITSGQPSPYRYLVDDTAHYASVTLPLQMAGLTTETGYQSVIDQQLATRAEFADYVSGSVRAFPADRYVPKYESTTSDHYPVIAQYRVVTASAGARASSRAVGGGAGGRDRD